LTVIYNLANNCFSSSTVYCVAVWESLLLQDLGEHHSSLSFPSTSLWPQISVSCKSLNHRIIEWFGLEGTLKIIWFHPPCHEQEHLPPDQVAQSSIQPGLEYCQERGSHSFSGQPEPVFHHLHGEEVLPNISSKSALF